MGFACIEGGSWITDIVLAIYEFSLPVLIGTATVAVYTMVSAGLLGLKLHIDACTQRVLQAVEVLADEASSSIGSD